MHTRSRPALLATLLAAVLLVAAGCGGGDDSSPEGDGGGDTVTAASGDVNKDSPAYTGAYELCNEGTVEEVADLYGVPVKTPDAVSDAIAEQVAGANGPDDVAAGKQGCLDAFAAQ